MNWEKASGFLERFKKIKPPKDFLQEEIVKILQDKINSPLNKENIEIKGNVIFIKTDNQSLKNDLFIKRKKILEEISRKLGPRSPTIIRF